jgi:hypothetical protein
MRAHQASPDAAGHAPQDAGSSPPSDTSCGALPPDPWPPAEAMQAEDLPGTRTATPAAPGLVRAKVTERMVASLSPARPVRAASVAPGAGPLWRPLVPLSATALALFLTLASQVRHMDA